ncbi:HigA family addiction module antitoxin [Pseudoduganella sp. OTU4001]|uniref:HigA family addiction module antitoxin n=1 Tax=Pseudoduganella sp. OTU4001 TaxID=3043854 RepID=UPI00313E41FA
MITMHPGEYLAAVYIEALALSQADLAKLLQVSKSAVSRLVAQESDLSPEMAVRLSYVFDVPAEMWMEMQTQHSLRLAREKLKSKDFVKAPKLQQEMAHVESEV